MTNLRDDPTIIGLSGKAGTGKTSVASTIVPEGTLAQRDDIVWDHLFLAMPLYELASIRRKTEGAHYADRVQYQVHDVLVDLFGGSPLYGAPPYSELVSLAHEITFCPIEMNLDVKPREFLQSTGTLLRSVDPDCFIKWINNRIKRNFALYSEKDMEYATIISDIRMPNEAAFVHNSPRGTLIRFDASDATRAERLERRDGTVVSMTESQSQHESEQIQNIPEEYFDIILDTNGMSLSEQASATFLSLFQTTGE